jgi:predicted transcriptional regulator
MEQETLINLAAEIVSAHVSNNKVALADLPGLIEAVYGSLARVSNPAPAEVETPKPAVALRSSLKADAITCLECGEKLKMLKRHLATDHGLSPAEYRARWGLAADYPMVAPDYSDKRRALAKTIGLGRKPGTKMPARKPLNASKDATMAG